ncbi:MAG: tetratricopeptide repeat protein [Vicinamibacterales bacterium]
MTRLLSATAPSVRTFSTIAIACLVLTGPAFAQDPAQVQRWFESGRFQQVAAAASPEAPPEVRYLAGQSLLKQNAPAQAAEVFAGLATLPESNPWRFIGRAAELLVQNQFDDALANARQAVALNGDLTEAHYELGLVHFWRSEWAEAAQAFTRAAALNPRFAYAHYYGGLAQSKAGRPDLMATEFEAFLRTAPEAPERAEVTQVMRSIRGR